MKCKNCTEAAQLKCRCCFHEYWKTAGFLVDVFARSYVTHFTVALGSLMASVKTVISLETWLGN